MHFPRWVYRGSDDWRYNPIYQNRKLVKNITEYCEAIEIDGWRESPIPGGDPAEDEEKTVIENQEEPNNEEYTPDGWRESPIPGGDPAEYEEKTVIENQEEPNNEEYTPLFPKRGRGRPRKVL